MSEADFIGLHDQSKAAWDTNAAFWDQRMGEGNEFHRKLVEPATLALLELEPGQRVLEAACGNGQFARRIAGMGAAVTAFDFSAPMIDIAKARTGAVLSIDYRVIDAVDSGALLGLGEKRFDAAVCSMALMDMSDIAPLLGALPVLLKPSGRFVGLNNNVRNVAAAPGSLRKYGLERTWDRPLAEGDVIRYTMFRADGEQFGFDNYYLAAESHTAAFERAGFRGFRWVDMALHPSEADNPFWDEFMANPPIVAFEAKR